MVRSLYLSIPSACIVPNGLDDTFGYTCFLHMNTILKKSITVGIPFTIYCAHYIITYKLYVQCYEMYNEYLEDNYLHE